MHQFYPRLTALAAALLLPWSGFADEPRLRLQRSIVGAPSAKQEQVPVFLSADRLEGISDKETTAEGDAELRKGTTVIQADWMKYLDEGEDVDARGNVRLERNGDVVTGPTLKYRVKDATGVFDRPEYILAPRQHGDLKAISGRGDAEKAIFEGEDKYRLLNSFFTTCKPGNKDWYMQTGELDLDYEKEVGTARQAKVIFKGVPVLQTPYLDFALNNQRKSGFLPPTVGATGKSGAEITAPYYFNLAPNRDLTLSPRYMVKRGLQLGGDFRYLEPTYYGETKAEVLPNDRAANVSRSAISAFHSYRSGPMTAGFNLNRASDDNYFRDMSSRMQLVAQTYLPREGYLTYGGGWRGFGWGASARFQGYQVLQDTTRSIPVPYSRAPQLNFNAGRLDVGGMDFNLASEAVDFRHPTSVLGVRSTLYPSLSMPIIAPGMFFTPKLGLHATRYSLEGQPEGTPGTMTRTLPIFSLDSGLVFERDMNWRGQGLTQTLEPRAYYLVVPYRNQNQIPIFDTGLADFNYAQIFSENIFGGGDRIADANQVTLALTSRLLSPRTGQEAVRATIGQIYYFRDQRVTLNPTDTPRSYHTSDWLASVSGRITRALTVDTAMQYNGRQSQMERVTVGTRYQPELLKTLNLSYRFLRDQVHQVDVSGQWPFGAGFYGVGRFNYSLFDHRVIETLGGIEYDGGCWIFRAVGQRFASAASGTAVNAMFLQLELNGFSRIGSNPLQTLKRTVPGYARINQAIPTTRPYDFDD